MTSLHMMLENGSRYTALGEAKETPFVEDNTADIIRRNEGGIVADYTEFNNMYDKRVVE